MAENQNKKEKIALFIDHENFVLSLKNQYKIKLYNIDVIVSRVQEEGEISIGKVYIPSYEFGGPILHSMKLNGIEPIYCHSYGNEMKVRKNLGDTMLLCDAMEVLYEKSFIDKFVLVSGDKDYIPFIEKIVNKKKKIMVIGIQATTAIAVIQTLNKYGFKFIDYMNLHQRVRFSSFQLSIKMGDLL